MKKILAVIILIAGLHTASFAQEERQRPTPEQRATRMTDMMTRSLKLTEDQKAKVSDINLKTALQSEKFGGTRDTANYQIIQQAREGAFKKVLTEEQYKQYEEMKAERREHRRDLMRKNQEQ